MTQYELVDTHLSHRAALAPRGWLSALGAQICVWAATSAEYYTAAARYEQLSSLCDAELARRGLSRTTLARDVVGQRPTPPCLSTHTRHAATPPPNRPHGEIDLLTLEDDMMRRSFTTNPTARACQTVSLLVVLLMVLGMFAHELTSRNGVVTTTLATDTEQPRGIAIAP